MSIDSPGEGYGGRKRPPLDFRKAESLYRCSTHLSYILRDIPERMAGLEPATPNPRIMTEKLHVAGRGELCGSKEEADMVFDVEEGITPFDTEILLAEYM